MNLSGSIKEFISIFMAAEDLKAPAIHFISPNTIFILAENKKDYIYARTTVIIGQSLLIPRTSYNNMHLYIKASKKAYRNPDSPFYLQSLKNVSFIRGRVRFNQSDDLTIEIDIPSYPLKKEVEFKIQETIQSSFDLEAPFLNLPSEEADRIHSILLKNKRRYLDKTRKSADNAIRIENGQLILYSMHDGKEIKVKNNLAEYSISEPFKDIPYTFSDRSFYLFRWMAQTTPVNELVFIPRERCCIIEGYKDGLSIKVRTGIHNDLQLKKCDK